MEDDAHVADVSPRCCVLTMIEYDTHVVDDGPRCRMMFMLCLCCRIMSMLLMMVQDVGC